MFEDKQSCYRYFPYNFTRLFVSKLSEPLSTWCQAVIGSQGFVPVFYGGTESCLHKRASLFDDHILLGVRVRMQSNKQFRFTIIIIELCDIHTNK